MRQFVSPPADLLDFIKNGELFIVAGHKEPDGDCVGSQLALCSALRRTGKKAFPCSDGPFKRTEVMPFAERFSALPGERERAGARVILVDCSSPERTGGLAPHLEGLPLALIDHHSAGDHCRYSPVYLDANAPSVTCMILSLIEALGLSLAKEEAELLFFGLCTDTGFFRHLDEGSEETFTAAAKMIGAGANPKRTFQAINGGKRLESRLLLGHILSRAEALFNDRLVVSFETREDIQRLGLESRDSDMLYQLLQSVAGVEAIAIVREEAPLECTVGLRSRDQIDVAAVAQALGGGGHRNAAGFSMKGSIQDTMAVVVKSFEQVFGQAQLAKG